MSELISVIVPVYNVEKYLNPCIESIVGQTYHELEIILVDDGSTDTSGSICNEWAARDARIQVIHQSNQGLPSARNSGLAAASGAFLAFVDSDDLLHPKMYEYLHTALERSGAQLGICHELLFDGAQCPFEAPEECRIERTENQEQLMSHMMDDWTITINVVWNKLYRRSIAQDIRFEQVRYCEDACYTAQVLCRVDTAVWVEGSLYGYRQHADSILGHKGIQMYLGSAQGILRQREILAQTGLSDLQHRMDSYVLRKIAHMRLEAQQEGLSEGALELKQLYRETYQMITDRSFPAKERLNIELARYCWWGYCLLHR